jgi:Na+-transporting methylmalonyl-CoA/oxaloacetate decarboxylase gamma subunit
VSLDQLFIALLIVLVVFINVVLPMLRRAAQEAQEDDGAEEAEQIVPAASVRRRIVPVAQARIRPSQDRPQRPLPAPGVAPKRWMRARMLREARRGVVLMTILGPCRANESSASAGSFR